MRTIRIFGVVLCLIISYGLKAQTPAVALSKAQKGAVVANISQKLKDNYVFPDTAAKMGSYISKRWKEGAYEKLTDPLKFAEILTTDLHHVYPDGHMAVQFNPAFEHVLKDTSASTRVSYTAAENKAIEEKNFGFRNLEMLGGNIAYMRIDGFVAPGSAAREVVASAMKFVSHSNALIIDLRYNGGGSSQMVKFICGFFFGQKTHINDLYQRKSNTMTFSWTEPDTAYSALWNKPVYILVSHGYTYSAAEEMSYDLQALKRATIVGENTKGGAHPVDYQVAGNGFIVAIPHARAINPLTKTNWEGRGIQPDIACPEQTALLRAQAEILKMLLAKSTDPADIKKYEWNLNSLVVMNNHYVADNQALKDLAGVYEDRLFSYEEGDFYYQKKDGLKLKMTPINSTSFIGQSLDYVRAEFILGPDKKAEKVLLYNQNGLIKEALKEN